MHDPISNPTVCAGSFQPTSEPSDSFIDSQLALLRIAAAHPNAAVRAVAHNKLRESVDEIGRVQEEMRRKLAPPVEERLDQISIQVAAACRVSRDDLMSPVRSQRVAFCRQVAMYLSRRVVEKASFPVIGDYFHRNHATVIHAVSVIRRRVNSEPAFSLFIDRLEAGITGMDAVRVAA
jgi:chromosomal replication initiation ATPase DnaA